MDAAVNATAMVARVARLERLIAAAGLRAEEEFDELARREGLPDAARADEKVRVGNVVAGDGGPEGPNGRVLVSDLSEGHEPPPPE
jgi:hypothetical protein